MMQHAVALAVLAIILAIAAPSFAGAQAARTPRAGGLPVPSPNGNGGAFGQKRVTPDTTGMRIGAVALYRRTPFNNDTITICQGDSAFLTARPATTYHWDLIPGLSCYDCQTPTATPQATTTYHVTVQSALGGVFMDSLVVIVLPSGMLRAGAGPIQEIGNEEIAIPIMLEDQPSAMDIQAFTLTVTYDSNAISPANISESLLPSVIAHTLTHDWRVTLLHQEPGLLSLQFDAGVDGEELDEPGPLAVLRFTRFLTERERSSLSFAVEVPALPCLDFETSDATILNANGDGRYRLLASEADAFAFDGNHPNPFNGSTAFEFSLATAAHATLTIFDALGRSVAMPLDAQLHPGRHRITWDAAGLPAGAYICRLQSGAFTATHSIVLTR